jgi:redox-sensitive bicupin YhaK (pirin superfamily)
MSAGSGIQHSEFNPNKDKPVKLLQIWIYPNKKNVTPRYDQITLDVTKRQNKLQQILSPLKDDEGVWIYQDAWFHLGKFDKDLQAEYEIIKEGNGVYLFVIEGEFAVMDQILSTRDAFGIWETNSITLQAKTQGAEILLMELPMSVNA